MGYVDDVSGDSEVLGGIVLGGDYGGGKGGSG